MRCGKTANLFFCAAVGLSGISLLGCSQQGLPGGAGASPGSSGNVNATEGGASGGVNPTEGGGGAVSNTPANSPSSPGSSSAGGGGAGGNASSGR